MKSEDILVVCQKQTRLVIRPLRTPVVLPFSEFHIQARVCHVHLLADIGATPSLIVCSEVFWFPPDADVE
jgi:hypothetical protein